MAAFSSNMMYYVDVDDAILQWDLGYIIHD